MNESNARAVATSCSGVEWEAPPGINSTNQTGWPELCHADRCDGENPMTGRACINGDHQGYHRDTTGAEWLDD
ncbi:hypothetical protein [Kribbella speibonae]|uniref:Uncharacterized protein n=1 Tax=Kribbella speibonae TaxID=1572660 RepID=A0ABY2A2H4_9ACTN|nr:hypothetical protein [Kribbella speibonae]TCC20722.1 hypothetical protein E0H58_25570 [Kribbella speibonae]